MSEEDREPNDPPEVSKPLKEHIRVGPVEAEDPTIEWDPEDRFHRYDEIIARGRFKTVYRGYDTENGIDVAWCQVQDPDPHTSAHNLKPIYNEMKKGLNLDHSNIIRCFACWLDSENQRINLITELFTSGTLRSYIEMYSNVDLNVHRKYVRQILSGLTYLHSRVPPVIHADLRLDKIYVNGFNGEVKIGDLGLATLLTKRYHPSQPPEFDSPLEDLRALGVCVYELLTGKRLDPRNRTQWNDSLKEVKDSDAHNFLSKCFGMSHSVTAVELLEHPFLKLRSSKFKVKNGNDLNINRLDSQQSIAAKLRGEDWNFDLQGYESDSDENVLHIRLTMSHEEESEYIKVLDFEYNLEIDTPDSVGGEIADKFQLSITDREICKAAMKEWLAVQSATKSRYKDLPSPSPSQ